MPSVAELRIGDEASIRQLLIHIGTQRLTRKREVLASSISKRVLRMPMIIPLKAAYHASCSRRDVISALMLAMPHETILVRLAA